MLGDSGIDNHDGVTNVSAPAFMGSGEPNAIIRLHVESVVVGEGLVGSDGKWLVEMVALPNESFEITATAEDLAGNISEKSDPLWVVIDTTAPNTPLLDLIDDDDSGRHDKDNITNVNQPQFTVTAGKVLTTDKIIYRIFDRPDPQQFGGAANNGEVLVIESSPFSTDHFFNVDFSTIPYTLRDGVHNLKLEVEDLAGNVSDDFLLEVVVDTQAPTATVNLHPDSDTGVWGFPNTMSDRITSDRTPLLYGATEADVVVTAVIDGTPAGTTVAVPLDGNEAFAPPSGFDGNYLLETILGLEDGEHAIDLYVEDLAGNVSDQQILEIFVDTRGPQVTAVYITNDPGTATDESLFDLLSPKPSAGPTPLVSSLSIDVRDLPERTAGFLYEALARNAVNGDPATEPGHFLVRGDHNGAIRIESIAFNPVAPAAGQVATGTIVLNFFEPLPDDRFTLTISDSLVDPAGNRLDGESNAVEPQSPPVFPTGDGQPGGDFVVRFTVDSRPEVGSFSAGTVYIDINGNFLFDPQNEEQNQDYTNRDIVFAYGLSSDDVFAGNFTTGAAADGFDKLGAYGRVNGTFRWLIDTTNDGVADLNVAESSINGLPVAGNFDNVAANGDEVGLFTGTQWYLDSNANFRVGDHAPIASAITGYPMVGDFDGDGRDDLGTWTDDSFRFDLAHNGFGQQDAVIHFGFIGARERPIAADMDQDGIDDVGLWVPDRSGVGPEESGEWFFLFSDDRDGTARATGTVVTLDHPFEPVPFGSDIFAQFGDDYALPIVGNFDPPAGDADEAPSLETVSLRGTSGDDIFEFVAGDTPGSWTVTLNGVPQEVGPETIAVEFDGRGGNDTVRLTGSDGDDAVELWANRGTLTGDGYAVSVTGVSSIHAVAGGGQDEATFHDSAADDTFTGWAGGGLMTGPNMNHRADGFAEVYAQATAGGRDTVNLYDSPGNDDFVGTPTYAKLSGDAMAVETRHFESVNVFATAGGLDVAKLYDSAEDDTLRSTPQESAMLYGTGSFVRVKQFEGLHTYATAGGNDTALMYDSSANDNFVGTPTYGALFGNKFYNRAKFFETVHATSGVGGVDVAQFYDSPGNDQFLGKPDYARLSGDGFQSMVSHFAGVHAYATAGGVDEAKLFDSALDDKFFASPEEAALYRPGDFYNRARLFEGVHAYATAGGVDVADMYDSGGDDNYVGLPDSSAMYRSGQYYNRAKYFEQVHAHSDAGGTDRATVYDAVLGSGQAVQPPPGADTAAAKVAWLYQFEEAFTASGSSDDEPVEQAVDEILKAHWP